MKFYLISLSTYSVLATILIIFLVIQNKELKRPAPAQRAVDYSDIQAVKLGTSPFRGAGDAPVTVVEFTDFECPFCSMGAEHLPKLLSDFDGKVKIVYKNFPLKNNPNAMPAAKAAMAAAEQGKFWEMHDALFGRDGELSQDYIVNTAANLGLDVEQFLQDMESPEIQAAIEADLQQGRDLGVGGTPTFFVNGVRLSGPDYKALKGAVEYFLEN